MCSVLLTEIICGYLIIYVGKICFLGDKDSAAGAQTVLYAKIPILTTKRVHP